MESPLPLIAKHTPKNTNFSQKLVFKVEHDDGGNDDNDDDGEDGDDDDDNDDDDASI